MKAYYKIANVMYPEPYSYESELIQEHQVQNIPLFWMEVTQVQYQITNTDTNEGTFVLNFLFDDGVNSKTITKKLKLLPNEAGSVTVNSPFFNVSQVSVNVAPLNKSVLQYRTVKKTVNGWYYFPFLRFLLK